MKKTDIDIYYERGFRGGRPSVLVKCNRFAPGLRAENFNCSEETLDQAREYAYESTQQQFWEDAQDTADHYLGAGVKVYSAGRCGGHLIVDGLDPVETWNAIRVSTWGRFEAAILADIAFRSSDAQVEEDIRANRWNEDGAEAYNFYDKKDGSSVCISELKTQARATVFGPVVR
jgi:hypothetical protein